jgi:hypothetical protein
MKQIEERSIAALDTIGTKPSLQATQTQKQTATGRKTQISKSRNASERTKIPHVGSSYD